MVGMSEEGIRLTVAVRFVSGSVTVMVWGDMSGPVMAKGHRSMFWVKLVELWEAKRGAKSEAATS